MESIVNKCLVGQNTLPLKSFLSTAFLSIMLWLIVLVSPVHSAPQSDTHTPKAQQTLSSNEPIKTQAIALTAAEQAWIDNKQVISVGFDSRWPPWSFRNDKGEYEGIAVEITRRLAERLGLEINYYFTDSWDQLLNDGINGKVDLIPTVYPLPERRRWFEFSRPYLAASSYIIVENSNRDRFTSLQSLAGQDVALVMGYAESDMALQIIPDVKARFVDSQAEALELVSTGKVAATIADIANINLVTLRTGIKNLAYTQSLAEQLGQQKISFATSRQQSMLVRLFDKALETLSYQELNRIYAHWNVPKQLKPEAGFLAVQNSLTEREKLWLQEHPVIRLGSGSNHPPYEFIDDNGYQGLCADYIRLIGERLNIEFKTSPQLPWSEIVERVKNRQLDMLSCLSDTQERRGFVRFTNSFLQHPMVMVTNNRVGYVGNLYSLPGQFIAVDRDSAALEFLSQQYPGLALRIYDDTRSSLMAVSRGEVFAYASNIASTGLLARRYGIDNLKISGQLPYEYSVANGVRKDWPELVSILNKALDSISIAERHAIHQKWINLEVEPGIDPKRLWQLGLAALLVVLIVAAWNGLLRRRIQEHTRMLMQQEHYDKLTALPNRLLAMDRLDQMIKEADQQQHQVAALLIHLDQFKNINDAIGHESGDRLIKTVAERLSLLVSGRDTVARIDGVNFLLLLGDINNTDEIVDAAEKVQATLRENFRINGRDTLITASIGIAVYPNNADNSFELLDKSHVAMGHARSSSRGGFSFHTEALNRNVARRVSLEQKLYAAVKAQQLQVHYQPVFSSDTKVAIGVEALLRWQTDEGYISPEEFIPIAENNGLIVELGQQVLRQAIGDVQALSAALARPLTVAVNLSPVQIQDKGFCKFLRALLEEFDFPANRLELEITEGILIKSERHITDTLSTLKSIGVTLSMDDFGTGYSSLLYLRKYPFDTIKIDREFVWGIDSDESDVLLVSAAVALGHSLGLNVIAEGVETESQLQHLIKTNCEYCQGNYFSKPLPLAELTSQLKVIPEGNSADHVS